MPYKEICSPNDSHKIPKFATIKKGIAKLRFAGRPYLATYVLYLQYYITAWEYFCCSGNYTERGVVYTLFLSLGIAERVTHAPGDGERNS